MATVTTATATLSQQLAGLVTLAQDQSIQDTIHQDGLRRLRDVIGVALAAADSEVSAPALGLARIWGGNSEATLIGASDKTGRAGAAFYNGTLAHSLDFDDTHLPSVLHPSAAVVPAALAAAEVRHADARVLLRAITVGNEVCVRLGMGGFDPVLGNSIFFERGLHATAICGTVGAAVAAAVVLDLDIDRVADVIAVAASMGAGLLEANRTGGSIKRVHCGWAAHAGVSAAELVRLGITGPPTVLEGRFGFFEAFCGHRAQHGAVTADLGHRWLALEVAFKPYPANHFTHAIVDAVRALRARGIEAADVRNATIAVPTATLRTIAEPWDKKLRPQNGYEAKFSGPFVFAAAFVGGGGLGVYLDDFTDKAVTNPALLDLAARTHFVSSEECDARFPYTFPAIVELTTESGAIERVEVLANRGTAAAPLSDDELNTKFLLNARRRLGIERAEAANAALTAQLDESWLSAVLAAIQ